MTGRGKGFRGGRLLCVALLAVSALTSGCGRPSDGTWLRFRGFKRGATTLSVVKDILRGEATSTVDVEFENRSVNVGSSGGTGILVYRARVDYRLAGFSPPSAEYPLNLYLPPPAGATTGGTTATTGTLSAFPLPSTSLKLWLIDTGAFEDTGRNPVVELSAHVTFFGETDDGLKLETEGSIGIVLTNTGNEFFSNQAEADR